MKYLKLFLLVLPFFSSVNAAGQTYFPPTSFQSNWDTLSYSETGFCEEQIDSLYAYLDRKNTKSFVILIDGKIALEKYFGTYTKDSIWYYASAGKSVMSFLLGMAQQEGYLNIDSPTSKYLGPYWTSCTPEQELAITVRSQMAMATGLDDQFPPSFKYPDPFNCIDSGCLKYRTEPYNRWFYFNGPYRLTQDVLEEATGVTKNLFSYQQLDQIGWKGLWINYVLYGRARDMARFGHLMLNKGVWNGDSLMTDQEFYNQMITASQNINPAYGLLWWLNGSNKHTLPGTAISFNGPIIKNAPSDLYAALGKNDQKIYVVPSSKMVVVRQGNTSGISLFALSTFDEEVWSYINQLKCTNATNNLKTNKLMIYPNPASNKITVRNASQNCIIQLYDMNGRLIAKQNGNQLETGQIQSGIYTIVVRQGDILSVQKLVLRN